MKEWKRFLSLLLATAMCVGLLPVEAHAATYEKLSYSIADGEVTITDCSTDATEVVIPDEIEGYPVTSIGVDAFKECSRLISITLPDSLVSICHSAFRDSTCLTSITIPKSVTSIGAYAFWNCSKLSSITIPDGVISIESAAFKDCSKLTSITLPNSVTSLGSGVFDGCTSLSDITLPDALISIEALTFSRCRSLTNITLPDSVISVGHQAFNGCTNLVDITLPDGLTSIGYSCFEGCTSLTSVTLPSSVISIANAAFKGCTSLRDITLSDGIISTGNAAFQNCSSLTSIRLPDSLTSIGTDAFQDCISLADITIPDSVTSINTSAFDNCSVLTSIDIPGSVTSIGSWAFHSCIALESIYFKGNAPTIDDNCFPGVTAMAYYPEDNTTWTEDVRQNYGGNVTWLAWTPMHVHDWQEATCTTPKTCKVCGETEGDALGHNWQEKTCTAPKTCSNCGLTTGKALGHKYYVTGETETQIIYTCIRCSDSYTVNKSAVPPTVFVTDGRGRVDDTVDLELSLENNPGFMWLQFNVAFDTSKLSLESYENKNLFPGFMAQQISDGSYNFIWEDAANAENLTGDGVLATLSFKILDGAEAGDELPITISYDPENIYDENFENVTFTPKKGTVSVISFIYGDVNDDTIINGKDVGLLKQYVAGHSVTINEDAADVFYDHTINAKDSGRLKQAVAGKDVVLGPSFSGSNAQTLSLKHPFAINTVGAEPTIVITSGSAKVSDTVDVELQLANNPGFMWLQFNVAYDTDKLELTGCADSKLFPGFMKQQLSDGSYNFIWEDAANAENLTGNGTLATLTFKVLDGAIAGEEIPFTITYDPENIYDENFENVTFAAENGVITVLSTACAHTSLIKTDAKAATCTDAGNTEYWTCSNCGKIFADAEASREIELKDTVIAALGHDWADATCTEPKTCKTCGETEGKANGHTEAIDEAVAPTCTETGLSEGKHCSVCGEVLVDQEVVPATGHDWADATCTAPKTCKTCGATEGEANGHTEAIDEAVEPNCTETGLTEGKHCSACGEVLVKQEVIPANGHDWADATCTEPKACKTCGATEGKANGHTEAIDEAVEPTCTETGLTQGKHCSVCGEVLVEQEVIPANGHDWADATCTEPKTCKTCGATEGEANGHTEAIDEAVAPTCTETGLTQGKHCSVCGEVLVEQEVVPANGHDWADATCTEPKTCKTCGETEGKANGHTEAIDEAVAPTCTETGLTEGKHCSVCGEVLVEQEVVPANGHDWADATCTEPKTCKTCGATEGEANSHTEAIDEAVEPTCAETGLTEGKHCSVCGEVLVEQEVIPATGHDWTDATCTTPKTCKTCGATEGEVLGHTEAIDEAVEPTCTETGLTQGKHCSVCGEVLLEQEVIPATGHDWADATCTEPKTCKTCGATEGEVLGHDFGDNEEYCIRGCGAKNPNYKPETPENPKPVTPVKPAKPTPAPVGSAPVTPAEPELPDEPVLPENPFADVHENDFFYDAVIWAVNNGITSGSGADTFTPDRACTRAEMVTFLWRAAGKPEPVSGSNPFTDVAETDYFYKAVLWAVENGITKGTSETTFSPNDTCTRGQAVTFLYRYAGAPEIVSDNPFADVQENNYYYHAVIWAVAEKITKGTGETTFSPDNFCTRSQIVTFLYRYSTK